MRLKKKIIITGIVLWMIAFVQMVDGFFYQKDGEEHIIAAFSENTFISTQSTITASGAYANGYLTDTEREDILLAIAHNMGISNNFIYDCVTIDGVTTSSLVRTSDNVSTIFKFITAETTLSNNEKVLKNTVTATISFENSLESAFHYKDLLKDSFQQAKISADVSIFLKGKVPGALSMSEKNMIADTLLKETDSKVQTENRDEDLFTIYAYTDKIEEYLMIGSMKTNLNLVITYNENDDCTEITLATPFFNEDY